MKDSQTQDPAIEKALADGAATVLAIAEALPTRENLALEMTSIKNAQSRGYFLPTEEEWIKLRYAQYLHLRASLLLIPFNQLHHRIA